MGKYCFFLLSLASMLFFACRFIDPDAGLDYDDRIIIKQIQVDDTTLIEWYHYSLITGYSPDFIEFKTNDTNRQLICKSSFLCDVNLLFNQVNILVEKNHFHKINYKNNLRIEIKIDTTCKGRYLYSH